MCRIICERELGLDLRETVEFYEVGASTVVCWKNCVCWRRILQMFFVCLQILCGYDFEDHVLHMCPTQLTHAISLLCLVPSTVFFAVASLLVSLQIASWLFLLRMPLSKSTK